VLRLLTRRGMLSQTRWRDDPPLSPHPPPGGPGVDPPGGHVLVRVEQVALTSNVFTYGATGDAFGYWDFWPTGEPGWGSLPAWGTAQVLAGDVTGLPVGSRLAGLLPIASHALLQPEHITGTSLRDGAPHRRPLMAAYQHYQRLPGQPGPGGVLDEQLASLLRPLVVLAAVLADAVLDTTPAPATVVLTSASSRTARAVARELTNLAHVIGLTSPERVTEVQATGLYNQAMGYQQIDRLTNNAPPGPAVVVDLAGRADLRAHARAALADRSTLCLLVGATHGGGLLPGPEEEVFLAPERMRVRAKAWGPAALASHLEAAWQQHLPAARADVQVVHATTPAQVLDTYTEVLTGRCPLSHGHLITLPPTMTSATTTD